MTTILLSLLIINLHQTQSISTFWSCSDFSVVFWNERTLFTNDYRSGRSMRFVRKQYCWNRQALRHAEAVSGYNLAIIIICLTSPANTNRWCRPSVSKILTVPGSPILTPNAIFSENVETLNCEFCTCHSILYFWLRQELKKCKSLLVRLSDEGLSRARNHHPFWS